MCRSRLYRKSFRDEKERVIRSAGSRGIELALVKTLDVTASADISIWRSILSIYAVQKTTAVTTARRLGIRSHICPAVSRLPPSVIPFAPSISTRRWRISRKSSATRNLRTPAKNCLRISQNGACMSRAGSVRPASEKLLPWIMTCRP